MSTTGPAVARHDLLDLDLHAWTRIVASDVAMKAVPLLKGWVARGFPVMRRRRLAADPLDAIPVAIALPAGAGPRRVGFSVPAGSIRHSARPPLLSAAGQAVPAAWSEPVRHLLAIGQRYEVAPRMFGSLMWQAVTGLDYLTDRSDLDLLWPVNDAVDLNGLLHAIAEADDSRAPRIDGEILFEMGAAVQWAELHTAIVRGDGNVLGKSLEMVSLLRTADLLRRQVA